jgi:hypothetical protein
MNLAIHKLFVIPAKASQKREARAYVSAAAGPCSVPGANLDPPLPGFAGTCFAGVTIPY